MNFLEIFNRIIEANPSIRIIFFIIGVAIWLIGGNVVIALHYRRIGKSMWSGFKPFANPVKNFNNREWLRLIAMGLIGFAFMSMALYSGI